MMILKACSTFLILACLSCPLFAQYTVQGTVRDSESGKPVPEADVYLQELDLLTQTTSRGNYLFEEVPTGTYKLIVFVTRFNPYETVIQVNENLNLDIALELFSNELSEVVITEQREKVFGLTRLRPVEGTAIYAGKKSEVVLLDNTVGNLAANNPRQIYSRVVGLNIYDGIAAGLQLNIGGRGLDPNRTSNFNTRQNDYDISADALGYPESYYTPPAEALDQINVVRGAASLQYGPQFGGLLNFKMKGPNPVKEFELVSRQSYGSFNLFNSFNSIGGTKGKFSYYTYYNYKRGDGYRPNSEFSSHNYFINLNYDLTEKTRISADYTLQRYLAQQPGGLADDQFESDPLFSNRERNWFEVDWNLMSVRLNHRFSSKSDFSVNVFGLIAGRNALGFRGDPIDLNSNPVTQEDLQDANGEFIYERDLIKGGFRNFGAEVRYLTRYQLGSSNSVLLVGGKYYQASNSSRQGPGSNGTDADFRYYLDEFPEYPFQSNFNYPNKNVALFAENIFFLGDKWSITPGLRFEYINTGIDGTYLQLIRNLPTGPVEEIIETEDSRTLKRSFVLFGLGATYDLNRANQVYANFSQNYRSITFSDIRTFSPSFIIDPNIDDESGFTTDIGLRGKLKQYLTYDVSLFGLFYRDRIGVIQNDRAENVRTNIGDALIGGVELFGELNITELLNPNETRFLASIFLNSAFTTSEYTSSLESNVEGKEVEFIPHVNLKTGVKLGFRNLLMTFQYTYLTEQFTDAENSAVPDPSDRNYGIIGPIPSFSVIDLSLSYHWKLLRLEGGANNLTNRNYFTRRATGYPGPGIIPSDGRNFYITVGVTL